MSAGLIDRAHSWVERKREEWAMARATVDAVADGWVPDAEMVGLEPVDEFEESRPTDLDDCGRCEGQGMFIDVVDGEAGWRVCGWCAGTGQRGAL